MVRRAVEEVAAKRRRSGAAKEVMLAVANGLGFLPVQMVVEEGSFLKVAVDREHGQLAKAA
jgi:hypothetical protein